MGVVESMRRDWDERAKKDAFYYIASCRDDWTVSEFLESGELDYQQLVQSVLDRFGFSPVGKTALELGCGAGRMTHSFSTHFGRVVAFDVSPEMLERAKQVLPDVANVEWVLGNGEDLAGTTNESVDFVFSFLVLQHLPDKKLVAAYIREMFRVLKDSGLCLFQVNGTVRPTMNWKGRLAWSLIDGLWSVHLRGLARTVSRLLGFDPEMAGKTWHGAAVTTESILDILNRSGGAVLEIQGENTPMLWFCASKGTTQDTPKMRK